MSGATIVSWGLCLPNCPYIVPEVVCINPPKVPKFGMRNSTGHVIQENYNSSWFKLEFINETDNRWKKIFQYFSWKKYFSPNLTHYLVSRQERDKLYQPWIPYDSSVLQENDLMFVATSHEDHFNDGKEIILSLVVKIFQLYKYFSVPDHDQRLRGGVQVSAGLGLPAQQQR